MLQLAFVPRAYTQSPDTVVESIPRHITTYKILENVERAHHEIVHVCTGSKISCNLQNDERCF